MIARIKKGKDAMPVRDRADEALCSRGSSEVLRNCSCRRDNEAHELMRKGRVGGM
jgi:hypothetical protein